MSYVGETYTVLLNDTGYNYNQNIDATPPNSMVSPSRNVNTHLGGVGKRGGTAKVNSTAVTSTPRIMGMYDFRLASSAFQVFGTDDGDLYSDTTTKLKAGMSTTKKYSFDVFGDELYVCDGYTTPQTWDGAAAATSDITTPSADWSAHEQPFQCISHGYGASRRMWYLYKSGVNYSTLANGKEVSGGTSGKITIDTGDTYGLTGGIEFGDRLIVFGKTKAFIIDDTAASVSSWGWAEAQWAGGAAHWRLLVKTPTDLVAMTEDGDIYSVVAAESYGDYKAASLTRPAFMDRWIQENVRLSYIDDFHAVYDPVLRAIKFFVVRNGQTTVDTALVYFIDRTPDKAWAIHDNQSSTSGYSASCSCVVRTSTGLWQVYTGGYSGFIWKLEQSARNDDGAGYYAGAKLANMNFGSPHITKMFKRGRVLAVPKGSYNLNVNWWVDGVMQTVKTVSMAGTSAVLGSFVLDTDILGGSDILDRTFDMGAFGKRLQIEFYNTVANQDFFVSQIMFDHKSLSKARPS